MLALTTVSYIVSVTGKKPHTAHSHNAPHPDINTDFKSVQILDHFCPPSDTTSDSLCGKTDSRHFQVQLETIELHPYFTTDVVPQMHVAMAKWLTILATRSLRHRPYLATTGRSTSATGLVGLAFKPTDLLIGTRSNLKIENRREIFIVYIHCRHELVWYCFSCIMHFR